MAPWTVRRARAPAVVPARLDWSRTVHGNRDPERLLADVPAADGGRWRARLSTFRRVRLVELCRVLPDGREARGMLVPADDLARVRDLLAEILTRLAAN